ncbi:MAG: sugar ABC transporter permease [Microbacterium sp.]
MSSHAAVTGRRGATPPGRPGLRLNRRRSLELWIFLIPGAAFFALFFLYPLVYGFHLATSDVNAGTFITGQADFVGFGNFATVFESPLLGKAIVNTLLISLAAVASQLVLGLAIALLFNRTFPGSKWMPSLILLPWLLPSVVVATIWKWLLAGDGPVNGILGSLGLPTPIWLADPFWAMPVVIAVAVWSGIPYWSTILGAALKQVPVEQLEAAQLDGAGAWRRLISIVVPTILPVISVLVVMGVVYTLLIVDLILVLTSGGPANATVTLGILAYRTAFQEFEFGVAAAYGAVLLVISLTFALFYVLLSRRQEKDA